MLEGDQLAFTLDALEDESVGFEAAEDMHAGDRPVDLEVGLPLVLVTS